MPTLFLLVGFPGAGKTTTSRVLSTLTGAEHIWSDIERRKLFMHPTHTPEESKQLYDYLNAKAEQLLAEGKDVVFDTSFNFRKDRDHMRRLAARHGADVVILWLNAPKDLAKDRALSHQHANDNQYEKAMSHEDFERIAGHLEEPGADEHVICLDGTKILQDYVRERLEGKA